MREPPESSPQDAGAKERGYPVRADGSRQTQEHGKRRSAQPEQGGRDHHQQEVLKHVDLQKQRSEGFDRRTERQEDRQQTHAERNEPAGGPAALIAAKKHEPAPQVEGGGDKKCEEHPRVERPGSQECVERGIHRNTRCRYGWATAAGRAGS